jgi:hypothetical protein
MRGVWFSCLAIALAACIDRTGGRPYSDVVKSWVGRSERELLAAWGDPSEIAEAEGGGRTIVYKTRFYTNLDNAWNYCTTRFQVDRSGEVVQAKYKRVGSILACRAGPAI